MTIRLHEEEMTTNHPDTRIVTSDTGTETGREIETAREGIETQKNPHTTEARIVTVGGITVHPVGESIVQVEETIPLAEIMVPAEALVMIALLHEIGTPDTTIEEVGQIVMMGPEVRLAREGMEDAIESEVLLRNEIEAQLRI